MPQEAAAALTTYYQRFLLIFQCQKAFPPRNISQIILS